MCITIVNNVPQQAGGRKRHKACHRHSHAVQQRGHVRVERWWLPRLNTEALETTTALESRYMYVCLTPLPQVQGSPKLPAHHGPNQGTQFRVTVAAIQIVEHKKFSPVPQIVLLLTTVVKFWRQDGGVVCRVRCVGVLCGEPSCCVASIIPPQMRCARRWMGPARRYSLDWLTSGAASMARPVHRGHLRPSAAATRCLPPCPRLFGYTSALGNEVADMPQGPV